MGGILGGGKPKTQSQSQPAIGALRIQQSAYGLAVPMVYGTNRLAGNLIDYCDFTAIAHQSGGQSPGGKGGGGGGGGGGSTSYTYSCSLAIGLCGGTIQGIGTVWQAKSTTSVAALGAAVFTGAQEQAPWSYMASRHPERAVGYPGLAYVAIPNLDLGDDANLPNFTFEVRGPLQFGSGIVDAAPWHIIPDFLAQADWPVEAIGDLTAYATYCQAMGLFISPVLTERRPANEILQEWAETTNAEFLDSEGKLKLIPYGDVEVTGNGVTYYPAITPAYDLSIDDFFPDEGEPPVRCPAKDLADAYNQITLEFVNRANGYNIQTVTAEDPAHIEIYGLRSAPVVKAHHITDAQIAQKVANLQLTRQLYSQTKFGFYLGWRHSRLEPGDYVTLTEPRLFLDRELVRLTRVVETEDGRRDVEAEEVPGSIAAPALYPSPHVAAYSVDLNVTAGNANPPVIFEPPDSLTDSALEVWMAVSGGPLFGGCEVWVSLDGDSYRRSGIFSGTSRHGVLSVPLLGDSLAGPLSVDLSISGGELSSCTAEEAAALVTLCYADGEFLAYQSATLTGVNGYDLSGLVRGAYGTKALTHMAGSPFVRLDETVFKAPFGMEMIGKTIFIKLLSFNLWHGGLQALDDVEPTLYTITGKTLTEPPPNVSSFTISGDMLSWSAVKVGDLAGYEIRFHYGDNRSWGDAAPLHGGLLTASPYSLTTLPAGAVTLMICAVDKLGNYSSSPAVILTELGDPPIANVVETIDLAALGWPGLLTGGAVVDGELLANETGEMWDANPGRVMWTKSGDPMWATVYAAMTYETTFAVPDGAGGTQMTIPIMADSLAAIDLRRNGTDPMWSDDADAMWGAASAPIWSVADYALWPGSAAAEPGGLYDLRLTTRQDAVRGRLGSVVVTFDVPDIRQPFFGVHLDPGGSRVPLSAPLRAIKGVSGIALQQDGGNAVAVRVLDHDAVNGPLLLALDAAGVSTSAVISGTIEAY